MLSFYSILAIALTYLCLLFAIAYWGDKSQKWQPAKPIVYSLGLGIYCTSWAFYGVTGQAAETGWWMTPTYTGFIIVYLLAWPLVLKVAKICKEHQITSLADFIARRYGQSSQLAGLITIVAIIAVVPYIALQIRAIDSSLESIRSADSSTFMMFNDTLLFTFILAVFAILFGTRRIRSSEHNPGLLLAIAFESIVKLITIWLIGIFVCFFVFDSPAQLFAEAQQQQITQRMESPPAYVYTVQTLIGILMMFCLPRQFHMCFIENSNERELLTSRWLFPLYLVAMGIFALPIAYAGNILMGGTGGADSFMLSIPMSQGSYGMTIVSFLGGFSAASSMVIVSSLVLSIMVSNDLITPWIVRRESYSPSKASLSPDRLLLVRRLSILFVLLLAYLYHRVTENYGLLANTGLMAMALLAQFAPALLIGLFWRSANQKAAMWGILIGSLTWLYTLFIPTLLRATQSGSALLSDGPFSIAILQPTALFGIELEFISHGLLFSLALNCAVFVYLSLTVKPRMSEQLSASSYLGQSQQHTALPGDIGTLSINDIVDLLSRFIPVQETEQLVRKVISSEQKNWNEIAPAELQSRAENELAAIIGGPSAKMILDSATRHRGNLLSDVVELVDEASEVLKFNRSLLQSTIQNIEQGISVVDKELRLVAWNRRYIEIFKFPEDEIFIGRPVAEIIRFNVTRGIIEEQDVQQAINKRLNFLREGKPYTYRRQQSDGKVIELQGNPLPGGGFVTTYTDITDFVETQKTLEEVNLYLEQRVQERTSELTSVNADLESANLKAEQANIDKTRYFAAVSHDLLQPINAATLFASVLQEKTNSEEMNELSSNIKQSLENAEQLLTTILELTKLDAGAIQVKAEEFYISELLNPIVEEYEIILREKGLAFTHIIENVGVRSDKKLLRRVLQNLMSNAAKYTESGEIKLTVTHQAQQVIVSVNDTGPGISPDDQNRVFKDFEQLDNALSEKGLGLGLAVASRICRILGHNLNLDSALDKGSTFSVSLPLVNISSEHSPTVAAPQINTRDLVGLTVLVIDNEPQVLKAMAARLEEWGCVVATARDLQQAQQAISTHSIDIIIADYHLDDGVTGVDVLFELFSDEKAMPPVIINSADHNMSVRERVAEYGFGFLNKPTKPAALKRLIKRLTNNTLTN